MRANLKKLLKGAICFEIKLPDSRTGIGKTNITTSNDVCFKTKNSDMLACSIYNGIVEYAVNEYEIDYENLELEQLKVLKRRLRYNSTASDKTKKKYGFYGEVLLDIILRCFLKTNVLLARGYLYQPIAKSEVNGFDAFHLRENNNEIELWLGEAKFYLDYKRPISDVLKKIELSLSDAYVNDNVCTLIDWQNHFSTSCSRLSSIMDRWEKNPLINIAEEIAKENMTVVYPIMIAYQLKSCETFEESIKAVVEYVNTKVNELSIKITNSYKYKIFFIFLPVDEVSNVKEKVFKWIDSKEPLVL